MALGWEGRGKPKYGKIKPIRKYLDDRELTTVNDAQR